MQLISIFATNEFGSAFYGVSALLVISVLMLGYRSRDFNQHYALTLMMFVVLFTIFYLGYRFGTGYTPQQLEEGIHNDRWYALKSAFHGIISFWAIGHAVYLFVRASRSAKSGEHFLKEHPIQTVVVGLLWAALLLSFVIV